MKNFIVLAIVLVALFYGQRSCAPLREQVAGEKPGGGEVTVGGGAREWQEAPHAMMGMQDAMGGASGGAARAARDAVTQQLAR